MTNTSYNLIQGLTTLKEKGIFLIYNVPHAILQEHIQPELAAVSARAA